MNGAQLGVEDEHAAGAETLGVLLDDEHKQGTAGVTSRAVTHRLIP